MSEEQLKCVFPTFACPHRQRRTCTKPSVAIKECLNYREYEIRRQEELLRKAARSKRGCNYCKLYGTEGYAECTHPAHLYNSHLNDEYDCLFFTPIRKWPNLQIVKKVFKYFTTIKV